MNKYPNLTLDPPALDGEHDVLAHDYHLWRAINASLLKKAAHSLPAAYHSLCSSTVPGWSAWFGTYMHAMLLEPELVEGKGVIQGLRPQAVGKTFAKAAAEHGEPIPIAEGWPAMSQALISNVESNGLASELLEDIRPEISLLWHETAENFIDVRCKARLDGWDEKNRRVIDIKTADAVDEQSFERAAVNFGYHIQAAHYLLGVQETLAKGVPLKDIDFYFIVLQNKAPFEVAVYRGLYEQFIVPGVHCRNELLRMVAEADETGEWHQPQREPRDLGLPAWAMARFTDGRVA